MGTSRSSSSSNSSSTTTPSPSSYEQTFLPQLQNIWGGAQGSISGLIGAGSGLTQKLLGGEQLPGAYNQVYGVNQGQQDQIIQQSMRGVPTSLQQTGMLDSGAAQSLWQRGAQNVGAQLAQFNTTAQQNAAQMGYGGISSSLQPAYSAASMLTSLLPGLRSSTTVGQESSSSKSTQPLSQTIGQLTQSANNLMPLMGASAGGLSSAMNGGSFLNGFSSQQAGQAGTHAGNSGIGQAASLAQLLAMFAA